MASSSGKAPMEAEKAAPKPRTVTLRSAEGELFEVEEAVAAMSETIKHLIEDQCAEDVIPVPNVAGPTLAKVIEYCRKHEEAERIKAATYSAYFLSHYEKELPNPLANWDAEFVSVDQDLLFDMILAASYLNVKGLFDLCCKTVADMMRGKTVEQIRQHFGIVNDYSREEEAAVRKENAWAFEHSLRFH